MKIDHINYAFKSMAGGRVYCYRFDEIVTMDEDQWARCFACPYFGGGHYGDGVVCVFEDTATESVEFFSPDEAQDWCEKLRERLGVPAAEIPEDTGEELSDEESVENE